jgi:3D (Asp-Asp-Asp) domain-containing protein
MEDKMKVMDVTITLYGWVDNDPPGPSIAYPVLHQEAGGIGTFDNPITFAAEPNLFKEGTKIYVPHVKRYFIMEDLCASAHKRYVKGIYPPIVDLWAGGYEGCSAKDLLALENKYTHDKITILVNPTNCYPVDKGLLFT